MQIGKLLGLAILLTAQALLTMQWLAKTIWFYGVTVPKRIHAQHEADAADAAKWRAHKCQPAAVEDDPFDVPAAEDDPWQAAPQYTPDAYRRIDRAPDGALRFEGEFV